MILNLLCIEDDPDIRFILDLALQQPVPEIEIRYRMADSGASARELLHQEPADLLLLDQMLPDSSGLNFLQQIRRQRGFEQLKAIMLSARFNAHEPESWQRPGVIGLIGKPFEPRSLAREVCRLWQHKSASRM